MEGQKLVFTAADRWMSDENGLYEAVRTRAEALGLVQTLNALPFMKEKHAGQMRKGREGIPYIVHPLTMACQALMMGIEDDRVIAAVLLHDVVEDTGTAPEELPVKKEVQETVRMLSYNMYSGEKKEILPLYYSRVSADPAASLIKCLDRCNNLSGMAAAFSAEKMRSYAEQTERDILPLLKTIAAHPGWERAAWLLRYQMTALLGMCRRFV